MKASFGWTAPALESMVLTGLWADTVSGLQDSVGDALM